MKLFNSVSCRNFSFLSASCLFRLEEHKFVSLVAHQETAYSWTLFSRVVLYFHPLNLVGLGYCLEQRTWWNLALSFSGTGPSRLATSFPTGLGTLSRNPGDIRQKSHLSCRKDTGKFFGVAWRRRGPMLSPACQQAHQGQKGRMHPGSAVQGSSQLSCVPVRLVEATERRIDLLQPIRMPDP